MKKILVIGSGGAGKSTFSRKLGGLLGIPVIHLDSIYWKPNWEKTPRPEWAEIVQELLKGDSWIMDGNYGGTRALRLQACDTAVWLDMPRWVCMYRIAKRAVQYRNKRRPDMGEGCNERLTWELIMWVWNYPGQARKRLADELDALPDKNIVILRSNREIESFLRGPAKQQ